MHMEYFFLTFFFFSSKNEQNKLKEYGSGQELGIFKDVKNILNNKHANNKICSNYYQRELFQMPNRQIISNRLKKRRGKLT